MSVGVSGSHQSVLNKATSRGLERYLNHLANDRRLMPRTLSHYKMEIELLESFLKDPEPVEAIRNHLRLKAAATHSRKLLIWKAYLKFIDHPLTEDLQRLSTPKLRNKQPLFLTETEVFRLENACFRTRESLRNRLLIALALELGLRVSEILSLRYHDVENGWLKVIRKGGGEQRLPLTENLQSLLRQWQADQNGHPHHFLFSSRMDRPLSSRSVQIILSKLRRLARIENPITPHSLRHTFASRLAANGANLVAVKEFLGHKRLQTTERYLHVSPEHLRDTLKHLKVSPSNAPK